jgi:hypothetical protein
MRRRLIVLPPSSVKDEAALTYKSPSDSTLSDHEQDGYSHEVMKRTSLSIFRFTGLFLKACVAIFLLLSAGFRLRFITPYLSSFTRLGDSLAGQSIRREPRFTRILPRLLGDDSVFLLDALWIPHESRLVLLGLAPRLFKPFPLHVASNSQAFNLTFDYEQLQSPMSLLPNLYWDRAPIQDCQEIPARSVDFNLDLKIYIVHCQVNDGTQNGSPQLMYNDKPLALFDAKRGILNAAKGMEFERRHASSSADSHGGNVRLSVCIQPVMDFHPLITDIIEYYRQQGVEHVYLGLFQPNTRTLERFRQALANYTDFVSLGSLDSSNVAFDPKGTSQMLPMMMFANLILNYAKALNHEDLLMVCNLDDVLVSMEPTKTTIVEELTKEVSISDTCYAIVTPFVLWKEAKRGNTTNQLGQRFPFRCNNTGFYEKSIAVVRNSNYVGIHAHGACRPGTRKRLLNPGHVTLHHYVSFWGERYLDSCQPKEMVPSELALFQRNGILA